MDREIIGNSDENLNKAINDAKDRFDSQYKAGFVDAFDLSYVDYDCPSYFPSAEIKFGVEDLWKKGSSLSCRRS